MQQWTQLVQAVLPRKHWKFTNNVIMTFKAVAVGLKPSFLWDLFALDISVLVALVEALRNAQLLGPNVVVIAIANEMFLVNKTFLLQRITSKLIIDASISHAEPKFLESESLVQEISDHICEALRQQSATLVEISVDSTWCVPMLLGLLLDYPVLYWLNKEHSCLDGVPLRVYKVKAMFKPLQKLNTLYSFSVPNNLHSAVESKINSWFDQIKSVLQSDFDSFVLSTEVVIQPHVIILGHVKEATHFFRKSLSINPEFLPATCNLESMSSLLVERWHFRMLNDTLRNEAYREAIVKKVQQGFDCVLDIGTGTALLSLFAADAGASSVYACECSSTMVHIAQQVLEANEASDKVNLIPKMSTDLHIPEDLPSRVSLVVTETMDSGLLGEHVLQTLADAWTRLLLPPCPGLSTERSGKPSSFTSQQNYGIVIPFGASIWVAALESTHLLRSISVPGHVLSSIGLDSSTIIVAHRGEPYDSEDFTKLPDSSRMLTTPQDVIYINFNDPTDINDCLLGRKEASAKIECVETGRVDALMAWFSLRLDEDILLSSAPGQGSCWEQAIFPLPLPLEVAAGQELDISLSCKDGKLSVSFKSQSPQNQTLMSETAIAFLNNDPWMEALFKVAEDLKHRRELHVLDLSPFPVLGLQLVSRGSATKLSCSVQAEVDQSLVKLVAPSVEFLAEEDVFSLTQKFDVIVLHPICKSGELDQSAVLQLPTLRECLGSGGIFLPDKISVWGQLISSESLSIMSKVETDLNVGDYKIADFINAYQVSQHCGLYLSTLDFTAHSEPSCILELIPREMKSVSERHAIVTIHTSGEANAVPYWFELTWSKGNTVSTRHLTSHLCQAAMLLDPPHEASGEVSITARQQHGFLHFGVSNT